MKCNQCGTSNRRAAKFCGSCGQKITARSFGQGESGSSRRSRRPALIAVGIAVLVAGVATAFLLAGERPRVVEARNGQVRIPLSLVSDGRAHYFSYEARGGRVKFFVLQAPDGVIRAALDTCDVCFKEDKGYRQEGDVMVCNNCDNRFPAEQINILRGGCNPVPLERRVEGGELVLNATELETCSAYFQAG